MVMTLTPTRPKQETPRRAHQFLLALVIAGVLGLAPLSVWAQAVGEDSFSASELITSGSRFFGSLSRGLALTVEEAVRRWGEPNGYILGGETSGALLGGVRYGEGTLHTRNAGHRRVYWQGPSLGFDVGGEGARTMILVYNLPTTDALYTRFIGLDGSVYLVGGFGLTAATSDEIVVVPIRSGVGVRLGLNVGYLKFTPERTWNPF
jgi:hypothetical protein